MDCVYISMTLKSGGSVHICIHTARKWGVRTPRPLQDRRLCKYNIPISAKLAHILVHVLLNPQISYSPKSPNLLRGIFPG